MKKKIKDLTRSEFKRWLNKYMACDEGREPAKLLFGIYRTPEQAWNRCERSSDLLWAISRIDYNLYVKASFCHSGSDIKAKIPFPGEYEVEI